MFKILIGLIKEGAELKRWQMEIGSYLLKKGCGYVVGQVLKAKPLNSNSKKCRVTYISGLTYDFNTNTIHHRTEKTITTLNETSR